MSMFRRMLLIAKLMEGGGSGSLVIEFKNGVATLNPEGAGNKISIRGSEVILSE